MRLLPWPLLALAACTLGPPPRLDLVPGAPRMPADDAAAMPPEADAPAQKRRTEEQTGEAYGRVGFGVLDPHGDVGHLDTGFYADMTFGRPVTSFLSMEATLGWFDITASTNHQEVYGAPLTINARFNLPVGVFEPYAGGGIGGVWADAKASGFGSDDSVAVLLDAFAGVQVDLGGFALGAEFRYMKSDDLLGPGGIGHFQFEGSSFVLTGRMPF